MSPRRCLLIVGAVLGSTALAGCSYMSPQTTATPYAASDGVIADVNDVGVRNLMIIAGEKNAPGQFYGSVVNSGTSTAEVTFTSDMGAIPALSIPAGQVVDLKSRSLKVSKVPVVAGKTVPVRVAANGGTTDLQVPVLDGTLPEYKSLVPSYSPSKKPTTSSATASATEESEGGH